MGSLFAMVGAFCLSFSVFLQAHCLLLLLSAIDVDECQGTNACAKTPAGSSFCQNNVGSYSCHCSEGYTGNGFTCDGEFLTFRPSLSSIFLSAQYWKKYADTDECQVGIDICDSNATCLNEVGSYSCECNRGYTGDGYHCTGMISKASFFPLLPPCHLKLPFLTLVMADDNECTNEDLCPAPLYKCVNVPGTYQCVCAAGSSGPRWQLCARKNFYSTLNFSDFFSSRLDLVDSLPGPEFSVIARPVNLPPLSRQLTICRVFYLYPGLYLPR